MENIIDSFSLLPGKANKGQRVSTAQIVHELVPGRRHEQNAPSALCLAESRLDTSAIITKRRCRQFPSPNQEPLSRQAHQFIHLHPSSHATPCSRVRAREVQRPEHRDLFCKISPHQSSKSSPWEKLAIPAY